MNVLLIDINVKEYETIIQSCNSNTYPIVYSSNSTKNDIMEDISNNMNRINRIGIFADQNATLFLDKPFFLESDLNYLNDSNDSNGVNDVNNFSENVQYIVSIIKQYDISYIDYFACNSLNNAKWVNYYKLLMSLTNVIVGASNNATGNIQYGGDWIMESTCQDIEFIYFTQNIEYYKYLLASVFFILNADGTTTDITSYFFIPTTANSASQKTTVQTKYFTSRSTTTDLNTQYALRPINTNKFTYPPLYTTGYNIKYTLTGTNAVTIASGYTDPSPWYDLGCFFEIPTIIQFTNNNVTPTISATSSNITINNYNQLSTSNTGTLYTYDTSTLSSAVTETFTLKNGTMNCYVVLIGPGGWGTSLTPANDSTGNPYKVSGGAGGGGIIAYFGMVKDETYTITLDPGTNDTRNGTTRQGYVSIVATNMEIKATGGSANLNNVLYSNTYSTGITGGTGTVTGTGAISTLTGITSVTFNGGNSSYYTSGEVYTGPSSGFLVKPTGLGKLVGTATPSTGINNDIITKIGMSNETYTHNIYNVYKTLYSSSSYATSSGYYPYDPLSRNNSVDGDAIALVKNKNQPYTNSFSGGGGGDGFAIAGAYFQNGGYKVTSVYSSAIYLMVNNNALGYGSAGSMSYSGNYITTSGTSLLVTSPFTVGGKGGAGAVMIYFNPTS